MRDFIEAVSILGLIWLLVGVSAGLVGLVCWIAEVLYA